MAGARPSEGGYCTLSGLRAALSGAHPLAPPGSSCRHPLLAQTRRGSGRKRGACAGAGGADYRGASGAATPCEGLGSRRAHLLVEECERRRGGLHHRRRLLLSYAPLPSARATWPRAAQPSLHERVRAGCAAARGVGAALWSAEGGGTAEARAHQGPKLQLQKLLPNTTLQQMRVQKTETCSFCNSPPRGSPYFLEFMSERITSAAGIVEP